jgi:hypothetical protein
MSDTVTADSEPSCFDVIEERVSVSLYRHAGTVLPFIVLPDIYQPDEWTTLTIEAARAGLDRFPATRRLFDVGSGSGIIPLALSRSYPDRHLQFSCFDKKQSAGRNLGLNYQLFGQTACRPSFHHLDVRLDGLAPDKEGPPDLVIANIPQLPGFSGIDGDRNADPDDYHQVAPHEWKNPVRAFGLGLLVDVIEAVRVKHPGRFCVAFCRSSRVPEEVFDAFLSSVQCSVLDLGERHSVRDRSTPFSVMAGVEERFGLKGAYEWNDRQVGARDFVGYPRIGRRCSSDCGTA